MPSFVPSFPTADLARTVEFYREVLGFELVNVSGKGAAVRARLRSAEAEIVFRSIEGPDARAYAPPLVSAEPVILHIEVDDVGSLYRQVKGRASIIEDLEINLFGMQRFSVEDSEGMVLAFTQKQLAGGKQL